MKQFKRFHPSIYAYIYIYVYINIQAKTREKAASRKKNGSVLSARNTSLFHGGSVMIKSFTKLAGVFSKQQTNHGIPQRSLPKMHPFKTLKSQSVAGVHRIKWHMF